MDESTVRLWVEVAVALGITGLGAKEIIAKYQDYQLKRSERLLDSELKKEENGLAWITEQADYYKLQVQVLQRDYKEQIEKLQSERFGAIQVNLVSLIDEVRELSMAGKNQNEILKLIVAKLRIDMRKMDTSGQIDDIITTALTDTGHHRREQWRNNNE